MATRTRDTGSRSGSRSARSNKTQKKTKRADSTAGKSRKTAKQKRTAAPTKEIKRRLEKYRQKRDFGITPEPGPEAKLPVDADARPRFMIHKHDATRLHYDLRLEMDGVLASWAIPKGPSYDPSQKRLAVETEDHPLEYGSFEGRIPDGEYGAGDSIIWDRGHYDTHPPGEACEQRKRGRMDLVLEGEKLRGRWHLVRTRPIGGKSQWLCFKANDDTANPSYDVVAERPESVHSGRRVTRGPERKSMLRGPHPLPDALMKKVWPPMKATLSGPDHAPADQFVYEVKYDGFRGLAAVSAGRVEFLSRNGLDLSSRFPQVARALSRLTVGEAVLDGEVVAVDRSGVSHFQDLQQSGADERYDVFDLLWLDGQDLRSRPLEERRDLLDSVLANVPPPIEPAERIRADTVEDAMAEAERRHLEGLIAKRNGSTYKGTRSSEWLKLKLNASQELAILGYTPISNGRPEIGAILVGVHSDDGFHYAGKVGTGWTSKLRRQLFKDLEKDRTDTPPAVDAPRLRDARWVTPKKVAQVSFTEWTADGKLRHPSFQGLRDDKRPEECVREVPEAARKRIASTGPRRAPASKLAAKTARASARTAKSRAHVTPAPEEDEHPAPAKLVAADVPLTSPDKVLFPEAGLTKRDVFEYTRAVADATVATLAGRPIALQQWPQGIRKPGFFRQQVPTAPDWATTVEVDHGGRKLTHLVVDNPRTLLWLANQSALTLHMWHSRVPHLGQPDWVLFDLDPGETTWKDLIRVTLALKSLLDELRLPSVPKTSGKRGLHVFVPVAPGHTYDDTLEFAVSITRVLEGALGDIATTERSVAKRGGRLYLDAYQNGRGKTVVAPYSIRAVDAASVSAPLRWSEVIESLDVSAFNVRTMPSRLAKLGDLFAPARNGGPRLPRFRS